MEAPTAHIPAARLYSTEDTARLSGNTVSRIHAWTVHEILIADRTARRGTGSNGYSLFAVIEAARLALLADRGALTPQLKETAALVRRRVFAEVRPEAGFDLHARAAYGFLIEAVQGVAALYGLNDPAISRFVKRARRRHANKHDWSLEHLHGEGSVGLLANAIRPSGVERHAQTTDRHP